MILSPLLRLSRFSGNLAVFLTLTLAAFGHDTGDPENPHPHYDANAIPPLKILLPLAGTQAPNATSPEKIAEAFAPFAPAVKTRWDDSFFYVESNGIPAHPMMIGITAWQQQVPFPQKYFGNNAWRFPLRPEVASEPQTIKDHFMRGAIAIAVNGIPIFNPQNNRGEISAEIGELDEYGGHAGRADDYHYHAAPLHLQENVGIKNPIAYALDGYPIFGLTELDGSMPKDLDAFDGHTTPELGYHYHASKKYPYVNGGFHGVVTEREGQVDPQPRAQPVRPATAPLRGATITGFTEESDGKGYTLSYTLNGQLAKVHYAQADAAVRFEFIDANGKTETKTYPTNLPRKDNFGPPPGETGSGQRPPRDSNRQPWLKVHANEMDANHDGILTMEEFTAEVELVFAGYDHNHDGKLTADEYSGPPVHSPMGGFINQHYKELLNSDGVVTLEFTMKEAERMFGKTDTNHDRKLTPDETALPPGYKAEPPGPPRSKAE